MVSFNAEIPKIDNALQFGDAGRIEIWSKPTNDDIAAAMGLLAMKRQVLRLRFSLPNNTPACEFLASIAPINSGLRFGSRVKIRFDVPETELMSAAKLIGYTDHVLRLEIEPTDAVAAGKQRRAKLEAVPTKSKGEWGAFWQYLWKPNLGFLTHPDMMEVFAEARERLGKPDSCPLDELTRDMFGVSSRTYIAPSTLRDYMNDFGLPVKSGVMIMIDQAERVTRERKAA